MGNLIYPEMKAREFRSQLSTELVEASDEMSEAYRRFEEQQEQDMRRGWVICPLAYDGCERAKDEWMFEKFCSNPPGIIRCLYQDILTTEFKIKFFSENEK
jgi:hypothetical protein